MPHSVFAVANAFINKANSTKRPLTHLKLQKLIYYASGYYLAAYDSPLIDHTFEAWEYGPVVPALYHEFKEFGNKHVRNLATELDWDSGEAVPVPPPEGDAKFERVLNFVWDNFSKYSAAELSSMTHQPDSPWDKTRKRNMGIRDADIPNEDLKEHFSQYIKRKAAA